ncbi:MAG: phosphoribosylformylglycinamidine cyclo-ligase, partial [Pirellulales bacterium]
MPSLSYKDAGLDLDLYDQAIDRLPALMQRTHSSRVMPLKDGFAGLFRLFDGAHRYEDPVLVSGTDGVGTKIRVAQLANKYDTIGIDLVAMCVNDCLCLGAEPLFFLDYLAMDRDDPDRHTPIVSGVSEGCARAGLALIGGETAIMPGLYAPGDFDLAGFCVGVVERKDVIDGSAIRPGDVLIGIPSSGLHSNGYSLIRKVVFEHAG